MAATDQEPSEMEGSPGPQDPVGAPATVAPEETAAPDEPVAAEERERPRVMIPERGQRPKAEAMLMRLIATIGVIAIGVAIAAVMGSQHSQGWLIGLVVATVSVLLAGVLWSSRRL